LTNRDPSDVEEMVPMVWKSGLDFERERDAAVAQHSLLESQIATLERKLAEANSEMARQVVELQRCRRNRAVSPDDRRRSSDRLAVESKVDVDVASRGIA
jgi:hypothetical protein